MTAFQAGAHHGAVQQRSTAPPKAAQPVIIMLPDLVRSRSKPDRHEFTPRSGPVGGGLLDVATMCRPQCADAHMLPSGTVGCAPRAEACRVLTARAAR
jgi:hypothetical protein